SFPGKELRSRGVSGAANEHLRKALELGYSRALMCCFSGVIERVSATSIFARKLGGEQLLVYSMTLATSRDVAMILPLPIDRARSAPPVRFLDLQGYPELFTDLGRC